MKLPAVDIPVAPPHFLAEDFLALLIGSSFVTFGLVLLKTASAKLIYSYWAFSTGLKSSRVSSGLRLCVPSAIEARKIATRSDDSLASAVAGERALDVERLGPWAVPSRASCSRAPPRCDSRRAPSARERVTLDTAVQTKAIAHPTDSHLLMRGIGWLNRLANRHDIKLRQSFLRVGRRARRDVSRLIHGRGHKEAMHWVRKLRTSLGRLNRDIGRKIAATPISRSPSWWRVSASPCAR